MSSAKEEAEKKERTRTKRAKFDVIFLKKIFSYPVSLRRRGRGGLLYIEAEKVKGRQVCQNVPFS